MKLPELKIGNLTAKLPIIQGGMAIRISTSTLAAAVAQEGGIGIIAATGMSFDELRQEIRTAKKLTSGIIGINAMVAVRIFMDYVRTAMEEGIDLVIAGAGFSRDMFAVGREFNVPIVPIVSSAKLAIMAEKLGAAAVVVEGKQAGGHLGTDRPIEHILPEVRAAVDIPVVAAGGIINGKDIKRMFDLGADGVQIGIRFALTNECAACDAWKQIVLNAKQEDICLIDSPVGLPGRAIRTSFVEKIYAGTAPTPQNCLNCMKHCSHKFCIMDALINAQQGDIDNGLVFSGENVEDIKEIKSVHEIIESLKNEISLL